MDLESAKSWAKNIAQSYKNGHSVYSIHSQLVNAIKSLNEIDMDYMDTRWQHCNCYRLKDWKYVFYILTGKTIKKEIIRRCI